MALSQRCNWMAQIIADVFKMNEYEALEIFRNPSFSPLFEDFFAGQGSDRIFVYYQIPYKISESGDIQFYNSPKEFFVTDGEKVKLNGKGIYFVRTTPPGKKINESVMNDNQILFGEISEHTVTSLNTIINQVYKPLVDRLEPTDWGVCEEEQKKEFTSFFDKFANELKEALRSLQSNITLEPYSPEWENEVKNIHGSSKAPNAEMIADFEKIFNDWSEKIQDALEGADAEQKNEKGDPRQELDYWKQRMRKLTGISEQLRSKNCRTVYDVLTQASQNPSEQLGKPRDKIYLATSKWRSIELRVTEALNEAKDNVKYLQTLEKFIEPLYDGNPDSIKETLPALMNSIKMIHTIARYYNTNERMTGLFVKITNQMINNCKFNILNFRRIRRGETGKKGQPQNDDVLWDHEAYPPDELIEMLQSCIELNQAYLKQYEFTKERLMNMPKGKQFEFSPNQIFGRFDLFCRRVSKLIELFGTIQQFKTLEKHNLEGINPILDTFDKYVATFKKKNHKLLDSTNNTFDRDFVEFNVGVSSVETELQHYIDKNFEVITNIEDSLKLLRKFKSILHRDNLKNGLNSKYTILFHNYGLEIHQIEDQYQKYKNNPPIVRNLPTVSGSITWSRHLFHRISGPMEQFPQDLIKQKESRRFVKMYNKIGYTLFSFEYLWRQKWAHEVEKAKAGLQATLIIRHPENNKLYVNFDSEILTLIREAKCLSRIGIDIPESAKIVLLQEDKFKMYNNELQFVLKEYDRIVNKIRPNTKSLLVPHLEDLEYKLRPGMVTLTWTSMNIDGYLHHVHQGLAKLEQLIININDIMENRIENNLKSLSKTVLVNLPQDAQTFTLDEFVEMQEEWIREESEKLKSKNYEVEGAVEDLIQTICSYQLDQHVEPISAEEIQKLSKYYNWSMYQALLHATKYSLNQMKERICGRRNMPKQILKPFFEVDVHLEGSAGDGGSCTLKPTLEEVQSAINRAASHVLKSTKNVQNWNQKDQPEELREPFYDWIAKDKEIVKVILLLTGSIQGTKNSVGRFLTGFSRFDWLWKRNQEQELKKFNATNPQLEDFEEKLNEFTEFKDEVLAVPGLHQIGALSLKTENVKTSLKNKIRSWQDAYSQDLYVRANRMLESLNDDIKQIRLKIEKPAKDIDSLGQVMQALEEIRQKESEIEIQFRPVIDMFNLLETGDYLAEREGGGDEMDAATVLEKDWANLVKQAVEVRNNLQGQQAEFKKTLIGRINFLVGNVQEFRKDFDANGPAVAGIDPKTALYRLKMFHDEYLIRERKYISYNGGETLFGLPHQNYPELTETKKQIELLDKLYSLYSKVKDTMAKWRDISWTEVEEQIGNMSEAIEAFGKDCQRLPGSLKGWSAYKELKQEIDDMTEIIPLVAALAKPSIRPRHWDEVIEMTKEDIPYTSETFTLDQLLKAPLLQFKDDIEDITDSADKQLKLEKSLNEDIINYWEEAELEIKMWKGIDQPCLLGGNIQDIQEKLEEHIMMLNQFNAVRHVTPFKPQVLYQIGLISDVADTVEKWLKVQTLWTNLVSVFTSGDIAKQMPTESKSFKKINTSWLKIMERAAEGKNVIKVCMNDILRNSLGGLQEGLEVCQKKLDHYLETKKMIFPRFYFCSNADLLKILSVGSDPNMVQDDFEKLFAAINRVRFDEQDRRLIVEIFQVMGSCEESVMLTEGVHAEGNIEEWLVKLQNEMQRSVRAICSRGSQDAFSYASLHEFVSSYPSQVALLGIQMRWTEKVEDCLEKSQKEKLGELQKAKKDIFGVLSELTLMCLMDMNKLVRQKVETLVTIHVHQRDLFIDIEKDCQQHKIKDKNDFEWQKNTRVYWRTETGHIAVCVTDVEFTYSYEFLGAKERLCITPLTDRCYITLSQALGMLYGGAPAGPAGTGKTETVKDLGCTLGIFVVVTNCSDEHKFRDMAKIFKGISQSGLWGCFDEFNRISLPTLSVVAAQVESITQAKKQDAKRFMFPNEENPIVLIKSCAYFITMNPGYAGRQELPSNLKVLFRGVTMMTPDRQVIIMVKLASVGYSTFVQLSYKFNILYKLCEEQLSKQRHYDFGLRNILSVLRTAGNSKRAEKEGTSEEMIMARTLRDMNMSKFVAQDSPLFLQLLKDIFPLQTNIPKKEYKEVEKGVRKLMKENNLVDKQDWFIKIIQLYETSLVRHGFMVVGTVGSGKTTIMNTLTEALTEGGIMHKLTRMNPKAITGAQMYGVMNNVTGEWISGVFSEIWKRSNLKSNKHISWIVCDGPVDAIWIENLNTVLDDNKILTLANNERIPMTDNTKMVFEVENLNNASPATVSRCGIIFVSPTDLFWRPLIETWCRDRIEVKETCNPEEQNWIIEFTNKYIEKPELMQTLARDYFYMMPCPEVVRVTMMLNLLQALLQQYIVKQETIDKPSLEKLFIYCMVWALGGLFETEDREKFHKLLDSKGAPLPSISAQKMSVDKETVFDYYVDEQTKQWKLWEAEVWNPPKKIAFSQLLIPTGDSTRAEYIIDKIAHLPLIRHQKRNEGSQFNTLLVGGPGTAKTSVIIMYASKFNMETTSFKRINFSSATTPLNFQDSMESELEKKQVRTFVPLGGKKMTVFLDDMSMPFVNLWGDQITLEITRQLIEQKGFYFLSKDDRGFFRTCEGLQFLGAMNHPGGGRNDIPHRLKRHFFTINMTAPSQRSVENIYGRILQVLFNPKKYSQEVINMRPYLIDATISIWDAVKRKMLPTPAKFHYTFTIRELSRVFQGICTVAQKPDYKVIANCTNIKEKIRSELFLIALWRHECERTFVDKLINNPDKKTFQDMLDRVTKEKFRDSLGFDDEQLMTSYLFADFQRDDVLDEYGELVEEAPFVYEACESIEAIKHRCNQKLDLYNEKNPSKKMNLVIFDDALKHLLRITRTINSPSGNILLVGVGGSGKQSLSKLASFICKHYFFQISLTKSYNDNNLKEDIKALYTEAGPKGNQVAFVMTDAEIKSESFLEAINSMLATGEIPGLFPKDERDVIALECKNVFMKEAGVKGLDPSPFELFIYFIKRVKDCLHLILCFSPVGTKFRERSQKFPSLFSQCSIDWFLPWPEDALIAVSHKFLDDFKMDASKEVKTELERHMGKCHDLVTEVCGIYLQRMRRYVYVTPKSYLSFIQLYKDVYKLKYDGIDVEERNIVNGLEKLAEASAGVEELKVDLRKEEVKLKEASDITDKLLKEVEIENRKAKEKADEVAIVADNCVSQKNLIMQQKEEADKDLQKALPFLKRAESAVDSIKPKDIQELKTSNRPVDTTKLIMDTIHILFQRPLDPVKPQPDGGLLILKQYTPFVCNSYDNHTKATLSSANFLKDMLEFSQDQKDNINEETIELLEPYLTLKTPKDEDIFVPEVAAKSSVALVGMCTWAAAMSDYHKQSKIVKPKLRLLEIKMGELKEAQDALQVANDELAEVTALQARLRAKFEGAMATKTELQENAAKTRKKMDQANRLINSLQDNKDRWIANANEFKSLKQRLVGDVAKACAFVSYCGPFNADFRAKLLDEYFHTDLLEKQIPVSEDLKLTEFLVDQATVGEWNLEGLPSDDLSIQNGIMVTRSSRYPLMIDPQAQAIDWIRRREPDLLIQNTIITLNHPNLKEALKWPLQEGFPCLIESIEHEVDPMLDPILEKQIIVKGRSKLIKIADQDMDYDDKFRLYMTSRLANPHFSPELAAKATIIDFTVTQGGLEQQLLARLIGKEQKSLEDQLTQLQEEVTANTKTLQSYEAQLLDRLANAQGSLLDDSELIDVLATIKIKSKEVGEKLMEAKEKGIEINEKRELFRPVAARGAVLYFCVVEMTMVNWMYNTSLAQFLGLYDYAIDFSPKAQLIKDRVANITSWLTEKCYRYINRGLFEKDRTTFKIMIATKILIKDGKLTPADVGLFLKAGAGIEDRNKPFNWMEQKTWLNLKALSKHKFANEHTFFFKELPDRVNRNEQIWRKWIDENDPENVPVPDYEEKISADQNIGHFIHLCLVRAMREDRTLLACSQFIKEVLGDKYVAPTNDSIQEMFDESKPNVPVLFLLAAGADPTGQIDDFAKKKKQFPTGKVSMGEEMEFPAAKLIDEGQASGKWVVLNNCHLSVEFMATMEEVLNPKDKVVHEDFRLWITCEPTNDFPLGLLQMAIKVATDPPKGIKAGLSRTFNTVVNQDFLEKVEPYDKWRNLVFSTCFLHSIVQERRKFGPLGWCIPYEYNNSDLEASLCYIEKHLTMALALNNPYSYKALQYMVCDVQYGGRITDALDRELFVTYGAMWIQEAIFQPNYCFNASATDFMYTIPDAQEHVKFLEYIDEMPSSDNPPIFGLHPNADLTFSLKESTEMLNTLIDTQPKDSGGGSGKSLEEEVREKVDKELLPQLPAEFNWLDVKERLKSLRGPRGLGESGKYDLIPLNIFLSQEIQRFNMVLGIVKKTMVDMIEAIDGNVSMTPDIVDSINAVFDFRVPRKWQYDPTGAEISWLTASLSGWIKGLLDRHHQLSNWINKERPPSFWLTGFFNPQGFLTSMKQEVTRQRKAQNWSLDEVVYTSEVLKEIIQGDDGRIEGRQVSPPQEGVYIHGLFLEGAGWNRSERRLEDSNPKELYYQFPILHISAQSTAAPQGGPAGNAAAARQRAADAEKLLYQCPVYVYPKRNDKYLITRCGLKAEAAGAPSNPNKGMTAPMKWKLCAVALLCCKE